MGDSVVKKKFSFMAIGTGIKGFALSIPRRLRNMVAPPKVTWPSVKNTTRRTGIVLVVSLVSACIILLMDTGLSMLLRLPFLIG